jgi:phosphohistidine swiveling domain-containing protein
VPRIVSFDDPAALAHDQTGGKGANLSRLSQSGFQVPPGFCVTTDAYSEFMAADGLTGRLASLVDTLPYDDPDALERQTAKIRDLILATAVPAAIAAEIERAYAELGNETYVAVRSSGTAEDLADASFAGQHDSYLDVRGGQEVVDAVRRCWSSLWTARAAGYRRHNAFEHSTVRIGVVVQEMVRSDVSGVMFTGNPLTTATDETVINATWGLGEALVQGIVTPDQYVVQVPQYTVLEQEIGTKELRIVRDKKSGSGVVDEDVPQPERVRASLSSQQIIDLARLGQNVQEYYGGFPQDIEWAIEDSTLYLLQSRPITGVDFTWDADVDLNNLQPAAVDTIWTRAYADAIMTGAIGALQYSCRTAQFSNRHMRRMWEIFGFKDVAEMRGFKYWKGEWYFNVDTERIPVERLVPPPLRGMFLDFIPPTMHEQVLNAPFDKAQFARAMMRWHLLDPDTTPGQFLRALEGHSDAAFFEHCRTFAEGQRFMTRYDGWIVSWGHRGHADRDLLYPRRAEDPSIDYRAIKLMLNAGEDHDPEAAEREITRQREETFKDVLACVATKPDGPLKVEILKVVLPLCHEYLMIRDNERARPTDVLMFAYKRGFDEIGRRLYERGMIEDPRDHNCLSEIELYQYFRGLEEHPELLKVKIAARRRHIDAMLRKEPSPPKYIVRNRPVDLDHPPIEGREGVHVGTATSPGTYTGTARVVRDHSEMGRVNRSDILVTHSTDPGWNPVFTIISAVVVETGGMLSHASSLAREIGFPAVHLPEAMTLIEDGATITVDGHTGTVFVVDDSGSAVESGLEPVEVGAGA